MLRCIDTRMWSITSSQLLSALALTLLYVVGSVVSQTAGCPTRCLCFTRDNGMVVRCMFVGLTEVPQVPRDTAIL